MGPHLKQKDCAFSGPLEKPMYLGIKIEVNRTTSVEMFLDNGYIILALIFLNKS
jgi:hypothetical protein